MSKSVVGLLAGLAVLAAAGRARRGSFSKDPYRLSYEDAYEQARQTATRLGRDVGIMKNAFGGYSVFALPNPENRRGHELLCEVVRPGSPRTSR